MRGVHILEFSIALTGPYAAALLADQGAAVVNVERPRIGDIARWIGGSVRDMSAFFVACNRGERSIAIDLQRPEGVDIALRLAASRSGPTGVPPSNRGGQGNRLVRQPGH
ncbi:MAG: CoA transferase [Acidimicrobiaceae bacterium]|nr:CoA transferase [Acidimicrobiaceae bacterium]